MTDSIIFEEYSKLNCIPGLHEVKKTDKIIIH